METAPVRKTAREWLFLCLERAKNTARSGDLQICPEGPLYRCFYLHPETGLRCFIGAAAPDDGTAREWDRSGNARDLMLDGKIEVVDMEEEVGAGYLCRLQQVHDREPVEEWQDRILNVGRKYGVIAEDEQWKP